MKVTFVSTVKPQESSGDGMTEYAYRLASALAQDRGVSVKFAYALGSSRRNDVRGLLYAHTLFRARVKSLIDADSDVVHITNHEIGFVAGMLRRSGYRGRIVTTLHDLSRLEPHTHKSALQRAYNMIVKRSIADAVANSDRLVFVSNATKRVAEQHYGSLKQGSVIPNGLSDAFIKTPIGARHEGGVFRVGYLGALAYHKNVMMILETAKLLASSKDVRFVIYGRGEEKARLMDYKDRESLTNVEFAGFVRGRELAYIFDGFDAFFFPSIYEGFGMPVMEALSRGVPAIVYNSGGVPEEVRSCCFGADSPRDAARIIMRLKEKGYDERLRKKAIAYTKRFSWEEIAKKTLTVYRS